MGTTKKNAEITALNSGSTSALTVTTRRLTVQREEMQPILQNMLEREKQNEFDVLRLKHLVSAIRKRNVELKMDIKNTEKSVKQHSDEVVGLRNAVKDYSKERQALGTNIDVSSFQASKSLSELLRHERNEVAKREQRYAELEAAPKADLVADAEITVKVTESEKALKKRKDLVEELKRLVEKSWLKSLGNALKSEVKRETYTPFVCFNDGCFRIVELIDNIQQTRNEIEKQKETYIRVEQEEKRLHGVLHAKLEIRRGLKALSMKVGSELDQIGRKRGPDTKSVPERSEDLALTLGRFRDWTQNELESGKRRLDMQKAASLSTAQILYESKHCSKQLDEKVEELKKLADATKKAEDEWKSLSAQAEELKKRRRDHKRKLTEELSVWTATSSKALAAARDSLIAESRKADDETRENVAQIARLRLKRQQIEDDFGRENEKWCDRKLRKVEDSREGQERLTMLSETLECKKQRKIELQTKIRQARDKLKSLQCDRRASPDDVGIQQMDERRRELHAALDKCSRANDALRLAISNANRDRHQLSDQLLPQLVTIDSKQSELNCRLSDFESKRNRLKAEVTRNGELERRLSHLQAAALYGDYKTTTVTSRPQAQDYFTSRRDYGALTREGLRRSLAPAENDLSSPPPPVKTTKVTTTKTTTVSSFTEQQTQDGRDGCSCDADVEDVGAATDGSTETANATTTTTSASTTSMNGGHSYVFEIQPNLRVEVEQISGADSGKRTEESP